MSSSKQKSNNKTAKRLPVNGWIIFIVAIILVVGFILWSSLFKAYPVNGKKQMLAISTGDTYSGFIDRLAKENKVNFPIVLKLYQKFMIHDSMKAGVYEVRQGMSIREVMQMLANADNAQMNRILVIEGTTFKQLADSLRKDPLVSKEVLNLPQQQMLQAIERQPGPLHAQKTRGCAAPAGGQPAQLHAEHHDEHQRHPKRRQ